MNRAAQGRRGGGSESTGLCEHEPPTCQACACMRSMNPNENNHVRGSGSPIARNVFNERRGVVFVVRMESTAKRRTSPRNRRASPRKYTGTSQLHSWFARPPRATPMLRRESRAKNIAMAKSVASVVICDGCGERVAEIVADDGRALCSRCHLTESRAKTPSEEKPNPDQ